MCKKKNVILIHELKKKSSYCVCGGGGGEDPAPTTSPVRALCSLALPPGGKSWLRHWIYTCYRVLELLGMKLLCIKVCLCMLY